MATRYWLGRALARAQVVTITVTAYDAATTYKVTINTKVVSVVGSTNTATTASNLQTALAASDAPEFQEITWSVSSSTITGTANTAGTPFTASSSVSGGTGTIGSVTTTIENSSPSDINDANNWSGGAVPITGDSIVLENSSVPLLWNLDALSAVDITAFTVYSTFTGAIGLATYTDTGYYQYRPTTLLMQTCTTLTIYQSSGLAPASQKFDVGSTECALTVFGQGSGASIGQEVLWWVGTHASNTVNVNGGSVAIAALASDTATVATIKGVNGGTINCGAGLAAVTTLSATNCNVDISSNVTTMTLDGSSMTITCRNTMTVGTWTFSAGSAVYLSSGTVTTLTLGSQTSPASIDYSQDRRARTITNLVNAYAGSNFNDPDSTVTMSAGIKVPNGRLSDITYDFGIGKTHTIS